MNTLRSLAATDLNLLVSLKALLDERSVTRAAARVGITQPAMSRALARLRLVFDDPLLLRSGRGMALTARARSLGVELTPALQQVEALLQPAANFDPQAVHTFRIAMTDYAGMVVLPRLQQRLTQAAPHVGIEVHPMVDWARVQTALEAGELDAALGFGHNVPAPLHREVLCEDTFVCVARTQHSRIRRRLTLRQYTEVPHLLVSSRGRVTGAVDVALRKRGLQRQVAMVVPHFMVAPRVLLHCDYIATLARRITQWLPPGLRCHEPPVSLPSFTVVLAWHPLQASTAAHIWLREAIAAAAP